MRAWDPFQGRPVAVAPTVTPDSSSILHLWVPRAPAGGASSYRDRVQRKLELGVPTVQGFQLKWDEVGPVAHAFLGGAANYAPLDSELPPAWLHQLDIKIGALPRWSLRLGRSTRLNVYLPRRRVA